MAQNEYDVVIIGAGIGGLSIARELGKYKLTVCLIDIKEDLTHVSFYTLGSFINLDHFNLSREVVAADQTECVFHSSHIHLRRKGKAYILNKKKLYKELLDDAVARGVKTYPSTRIAGFTQDRNGFIELVTDEKGNSYKGKVFVDATGIEGFFSKHFGLQDKEFNIARGLEYNVEYKGPQYQSHLFIGKLYQGGYGWIFPFGGNRAILGYGSFDSAVRSELKKRLDAMFDVPFIKPLVRKDNDELSGGTIPVTDVKTKFVYKNIVCIGDSVSQVNPIVGEGHRFIMEASFIAAPHIYWAIQKGSMELLSMYEKEWHRQFYSDYIGSKRLQVAADKYSKNDLITDLATLFLATKRSKTFERLVAGKVWKRDIYLP